MKRQILLVRLVFVFAVFLSMACLGMSRSHVMKDGEVYCMTDDGRAWMEVVKDSDYHYLIGHVRNTVDSVADTLALGHEMLRVNPKWIYALDGTDGDTRFLFIYSRGNIFYWDEAILYVAGRDGSVRRGVFQVEDMTLDEVDVMWWDARIDACESFPPDLKGYPDFDRDGIRFYPATRRLYVPIMDYFENDSEFSGSPIYTGHFSIMEFDGRDFVYIGDD